MLWNTDQSVGGETPVEARGVGASNQTSRPALDQCALFFAVSPAIHPQPLHAAARLPGRLEVALTRGALRAWSSLTFKTSRDGNFVGLLVQVQVVFSFLPGCAG